MLNATFASIELCPSSRTNTVVSHLQAIDAKKLFIIDYHDPFAVYLPKILSGKWGDKKRGYAPRAIFFYNKEGAMMPIAIELSKPEGSTFKHTVYTPPLRKGDINPYWNLAKAHFNAIDFGYHELISHWYSILSVRPSFLILAIYIRLLIDEVR